MNETRCDVAIIGGGPVGAALAIALQGNDVLTNAAPKTVAAIEELMRKS